MFGGYSRSSFSSDSGRLSFTQPGPHFREPIFIVILTIDVWKALWFVDPASGKSSFGIGGGTIVLAINVYLLGGYTFGCHSLRHLIGGFRDQLAGSTSAYRAYACVTCLNRRHMLWAWMSLFWVGFTDLYVRLCSMGVWTDWKIL